MLLSDRKLFVRAGLLVFMAVGMAGCQVRPLYSEAAPGASAGEANAALGSIGITEVKDRVAQEVRNHLIFALTGGAGEPASPAYMLDLGVTKRTLNVANAPSTTNTENQPTAGGVVLTALYSLKDMSGKQVASGKRVVTASFDRPVQQFAVLRAERDAENRAARELADMLKLALAADLKQ